MKTEKRHECEGEHDLVMILESGEIQEIMVGDPDEDAGLLIGFSNLVAALASVGYVVTRSGTGATKPPSGD